ncbi:universal stress protein [Haloarchaeobius litoreus]|uniref:Universal stress protein n=1 Tax=Haloarchaeobius litoreus TaxID=755306 RepID=A0ABD6DIB3_9EURY
MVQWRDRPTTVRVRTRNPGQEPPKRNRRGLDQLVVGSVAANLVRRSDRPVLVVPAAT